MADERKPEQADKPTPPRPAPEPPPGNNQTPVWLLQPEGGPDPAAWVSALQQVTADPGRAVSFLGGLPEEPERRANLRVRPGIVFARAEALSPADPVWAELSEAGMALVLLAPPDPDVAQTWRPVSDRLPVVFAPPQPDPAGVWLALASAEAARQREAGWHKQVQQLKQRLEDRIIIERAKGVLVHRLHITEGEAYQRLRLLSRRQRRPIRDIAQAFLDTQGLLDPVAEEHLEERPAESSPETAISPSRLEEQGQQEG